MPAPLVLNSITRADLLALFRGLADDPGREARFLDDPAAVLAAELGWDRAQRTSAGNARLVAALRSPERRAELRASSGGVPEATAASYSVTGSTARTASSAGATANFSTGGVARDDGPRLDPAALRLGAR
ncbi:hypothetical protein BTM25_06020 [Actinomadura rubteroloni]|uniref:Uncharacterized protein n=1 Tax=Actinomadura rubteroloni TaxID=1926885 RepID=A0A2P4UMD5_9ACTN|nr:hypothetical protein [Actinomadura rubteroloni]POM26213.1 hypothetical protein BTM25_06020 [Actinomadura rubteroloni]